MRPWKSADQGQISNLSLIQTGTDLFIGSFNSKKPAIAGFLLLKHNSGKSQRPFTFFITNTGGQTHSVKQV
ncbi:MAG: hypothetical protein ACI90S_001319 [Marinobacter psychrophilus]|jgi:hypothetical protein